MERERIFSPGYHRGAGEYFPMPVYFEKTGWRLGSNGVWSGLQVIGLGLLMIVAAASSAYFFKSFERGSIFTQFLINALPAAAMILVFVNGGIDMSMSSVCVFVAAVTARMIEAGTPAGAACLSGMSVALLIGLVNGVLAGMARLPGLLVTLAAGILLRGLAFIGLDYRTVMIPSDAKLSADPSGWVFLILLLAAAFMWIQYPGFNARLAKKEGGAARALRVGVPYVISALVAGLTGLLYLGYVRAATISLGGNMEVEAAVILALSGACMFGLYGNMIGVFLAACSLTVLKTLMAMLNINVAMQYVFIGILGLSGFGYLYLYHWIAGLIYRTVTAKKEGAATIDRAVS